MCREEAVQEGPLGSVAVDGWCWITSERVNELELSGKQSWQNGSRAIKNVHCL